MFKTNQSKWPAVAVALALAATALLAGCTSDEPNPVGAGVPGELQINDPAPKVLFETAVRGLVSVEDEDVPYDENQVLYFGGSGLDSSSILVRYDLSTLSTLPDSVPEWFELDDETIVFCKILLYRLKYYVPELPESTGDKQEEYNKHYKVHSLSEPLDTSLYPGPEPAFAALPLLVDQFHSGAEPSLDVNPLTVLDWIENGTNGIIIREGDDSASGLIGYASSDIHGGGFQEMERETVGTTLGASLQITVYGELLGLTEAGQDTVLDSYSEIFVIAPIADVSTLHSLEDYSADLSTDVVLQTHRRLSPFFSFAILDSLPDDVFINLAVVRLGVDFDRSSGQIQSLVVHEAPLALIDGSASVTLQDLRDDGDVAGGQYSVDLEGMLLAESDWVGWDVTSTVQRILNGVLDPDTIFLVTAGESFTGYAPTVNYGPDFYLSRYVFQGLDHPVLKPHLEITYTPFSGGAR